MSGIESMRHILLGYAGGQPDDRVVWTVAKVAEDLGRSGKSGGVIADARASMITAGWLQSKPGLWLTTKGIRAALDRGLVVSSRYFGE